MHRDHLRDSVTLGAWLISRGHTDLGSTVVIVSVIGLVVALLQMSRKAKQHANE